MLRRNFLKTGSLTLGGMMLAGNLVFARNRITKHPSHRTKKPHYRLHGDPQSGCASTPEYIEAIEFGMSELPI